jgi:hypothetical protein
VDLNLRNRSDDSPSEYYVGLADYGSEAWQWHGPFTDGQVRLGMTAGMLSGLGNAFVALVAYDGADFDVVGLGINPADGGDTNAPPAPNAPSVTPIDGGLLLEWLPVWPAISGVPDLCASTPLVDQSSPVCNGELQQGNTRHLDRRHWPDYVRIGGGRFRQRKRNRRSLGLHWREPGYRVRWRHG